MDYSVGDFKSLAVNVLTSVLDGMGIDRVHIAARSLGGAWALWFGQARPERLDRLVLEGCPAFIEGMKIPVFMRLLSAPALNRVLTKLQPPSVKSTQSIYTQIGHGPAIDRGTILDIYYYGVTSL